MFLNYVYNKLGLSSMVTSSSNKKSKSSITISQKNFTFSFLTYLLFAVVSSIFLCIFYLVNNDKKIIEKTILIALIIFVLVTIFVLIKRFILFKTKESKPININLYNRDLPNNLTPAHARLLVKDGTIDEKTLASTILDLIDRGYLKLETDNRKDIFKKNLLISKTNKSLDDLFGYEKFLIEWFFNNNNKISSKDLQTKLKNMDENPAQNFEIFEGLVLLSFPLDKFYKKVKLQRKFYLFGIISLFISCFLFSFVPKNLVLFSICYFLPIYGFANIFLACPTYLLNDNGAEVRDSYLDFKRFLIDFSRIKEKTSEMINLWNFYLSYAVALDIDSKAGNEISCFFGDNIYRINVTSNDDNKEEELKNVVIKTLKNKKITNEDINLNDIILENTNLLDEKEMNLIDNISNEIEHSKQLYNKRKV